MFQRFIAPTVLFQSSRFHRFAISEFQSFTASLFQSFKVSPFLCFRVSKFHRTCGAVSEFQSFTASLFQRFITHNSSPIGYPKVNQDFVCLLWGKAEVRVAFNDRAERYHSRNLVTERDVISQYDLIVERDYSLFPRPYKPFRDG